MKLRAVLCVLLPIVVTAAARAEKPDEKTEKAIAEFLKAVKAKDLDELMKHVDVPWLAEGEKVIKDKDELKKHWKERLEELDVSKIPSPSTFDTSVPFSDEKEYLKEERVRKLLDQVLGDDGQMAFAAELDPPSKWYLLIRTDGRTRFVGGPYKQTYLLRPNEMPAKARELLDNAEEIELYSLDPDREKKEKPNDAFHGWKVLGKTTVKDALTRKKLVASVKQGVEDNSGIAMNCFDPRHGIRVTHKGTTMDFVICFHCLQVYVYEGEKDEEKRFLITNTPEADFDKVLTDAKVPLAEKAKK